MAAMVLSAVWHSCQEVSNHVQKLQNICSDVTHERLVVLLCWMLDRTTFDYHLCFEQLIWPIDFDHRTGPKQVNLQWWPVGIVKSVFFRAYLEVIPLEKSLIYFWTMVFFFSLWTWVSTKTWPSPHKLNSIAINEFQFFSARAPVYVYMSKNAQPHYNHSAKVRRIPDF